MQDGTTSAEDAIRATVERYLAAIAEGDYATACDQLTGKVLRDMTAYATGHLALPADAGGTAALEKIMGAADRTAAAEVLHSAEVTDVRVDGDAATVTIAGATTAPKLRREHGTWRISRLAM